MRLRGWRGRRADTPLTPLRLFLPWTTTLGGSPLLARYWRPHWASRYGRGTDGVEAALCCCGRGGVAPGHYGGAGPAADTVGGEGGEGVVVRDVTVRLGAAPELGREG